MDTLETLLPSGRAVRYTEISVEQLQLAEQRAAAVVGATPDPGGIRFAQRRVRELIGACVREITAPVELIRVAADPSQPDGPKVVDIDATLDAIPAEAWRAVSPLELERKGDGNYYVLFARVSDLVAMEARISNTMVRKDELDLAQVIAGKVRTRSST
jgi:hypothetical protein